MPFEAAENLVGERQVAHRAPRVCVIEQRGLAVTGRFAEADVARNHRFEHLVAEVAANFGGDLACEVAPQVRHRQQDALEPEPGVQALAHGLDSLEQTRQALEGVVLTLHRNHD